MNHSIPESALSRKGVVSTTSRFLRRGIGIARVFERKTTDHYLKSRCTAEDGLAIDKRTVRDAISSRGGEVIKAVKTIVSSLFEAMPLCIDPNSGNLVNVRRKLEENDGNHSEVTAALTERLEKERCELMEKLRITELLIAHSNQFLDNLKLSAGFFPIIHSLYDGSGHGL